MNDILCKQIAADYCCSQKDVLDHQNHFTHYQFLPGRRRFQEGSECFLKIAVINGKALFTGSPGIITWCRNEYVEAGAEWFFEAKNLRLLNDRLHEDGYQIQMVHPFYMSERITEVDTADVEIRWYENEAIEQFRGDDRYSEAFAFDKDAPDVLGVSAVRKGLILGMAGASSDSPTMWQIGININPESREAGIGTMLVTLLKNEVLRRGFLPYYGTSMSHIASQRVALGAGFLPAWAELVTSKMREEESHIKSSLCRFVCPLPMWTGLLAAGSSLSIKLF